MGANTGLVDPAFADAAGAAAGNPQHQGSLAAGGEGLVYGAVEAGVTLQIRVTKQRNQWIVAEARYSGADPAPLRGVIEVFCRCIEGVPLREAADHGAIYALERLRADTLARPVPGILTPRSAGAAFPWCERLIRAILAEFALKQGERDTTNFWNPAFSASWRAGTDAERIVRLQPALGRFRASRGLSAADIWIAGIEKTRRVIVDFGPNVGYRDKPVLLMRLEAEIRRDTGDRLELFMAEAKDDNPIRRLAPDEEKP
jgi:hypothetical protein